MFRLFVTKVKKNLIFAERKNMNYANLTRNSPLY